MQSDEAGPWGGGRATLAAQYATDANLNARQSIYDFQQPPVDLAAQVVSALDLRGDETIADIGCGNGKYLAKLAGGARVLGVDLSAGMLAAARQSAPLAAVAVADATALPLADGVCDVALAMHMLYHVPRPLDALRELRRVVRPGGRVLITLNGEAHLRQMRDVLDAVLAAHGQKVAVQEQLRLDNGEALASEVFGSVKRHEFGGELFVPDIGPVERYLRSLIIAQQVDDYESAVGEACGRIPFDQEGVFRVQTDTGLLICA